MYSCVIAKEMCYLISWLVSVIFAILHIRTHVMLFTSFPSSSVSSYLFLWFSWAFSLFVYSFQRYLEHKLTHIASFVVDFQLPITVRRLAPCMHWHKWPLIKTGSWYVVQSGIIEKRILIKCRVAFGVGTMFASNYVCSANGEWDERRYIARILHITNCAKRTFVVLAAKACRTSCVPPVIAP